MGVEIEVGGMKFSEVEAELNVAPRPRTEAGGCASRQQEQFLARMENWRKVVHGKASAGGASQYCAGWAKLYVQLRTSEAAPASDVMDERIKPLSPLVSADELDGWLVEAAWRTLGDNNARQALKCLYIQRWPVSQLRRFLKGVRGPHVELVVSKAERDIKAILAKVGSVDAIHSAAVEK